MAEPYLIQRTPHAKPEPISPETSLSVAGEAFLARQRVRRREKTVECQVGNLKRLLELFGDIPLSKFSIDHFEEYQRERRKAVGASAVNHELNTLGLILRQVDLWDPIKRRYSPLKETGWKPPKIFTVAEQDKLFKKLKGNPKLELAEIVFTITRNTTASGCELRGLRLRNVELEADPPRFHIPEDATKNNIRPRTIALNPEAVAAFRRALARAARLGCKYPEHYLFPFRVNRSLCDPRKPASESWLSKQTALLRQLTGIEHINPHVFRHLAVTEMLEKGAPEQNVIAVAGWVSRKMIETYSHARIEAKAEAVALLASGPRALPKNEKETAAPANVSGNGIFFHASSWTWAAPASPPRTERKGVTA